MGGFGVDELPGLGLKHKNTSVTLSKPGATTVFLKHLHFVSHTWTNTAVPRPHQSPCFREADKSVLLEQSNKTLPDTHGARCVCVCVCVCV